MILDFDGTLADAEIEGRSFKEHFLEESARKLAMPLQSLKILYGRAEHKVKQDHTRAWVYQGVAVCTASDPYILPQVVMEDVLNYLASGKTRIPHDTDALQDLNKLLYDLFVYAYANKETAFREGAEATKGFLDALLPKHPAVIVSNSSTARITERLALLGDYTRMPLVGGASKFSIDHSFSETPEDVLLPGFGRPVLLRRKSYYDVLHGLQKTGFKPRNTLVLGGNYELDLALPELLGYRVMLMQTSFTPEHEMRYMQRKDALVTDYEGVLKRL